jgi:hypothetical protein
MMPGCSKGGQCPAQPAPAGLQSPDSGTVVVRQTIAVDWATSLLLSLLLSYLVNLLLWRLRR